MEETPAAVSSLNVLIVDDEINIRKTLAICLEGLGHRATAVGGPRDARAEAARQAFDLAFVDLRLGAENGMDLIPELLAASPGIKIIVITAYASIQTAVEAMRRGAADYLPKPFTPEQVALVAGRAAAVRGMEQRLASLQEDLARLHPEVSFESSHPGMRRAVALARQVAGTEAVVLLLGASGTGKSVLARAIHGWSRRKDKPLGVVSCAALGPELLESELFGHAKGAFTGAVADHAGRIAACQGGTLFLDEVGDLPPAVQPKLLRFLQDREYERLGDPTTRQADVRILAATNADLAGAVADKRFREDLYYRLNVFPIELPPLKDRPEDTAALAEGMLAFFGAQNHKMLRGFTEEARRTLAAYPWPGNIRELRNVVERAAILCGSEVVGVEHLPEGIAPLHAPVRLGDAVSLAQVEEQHIRRVLASTPSLQEAADILGIDQATLWRRRKQYGI